MSASEDLQKLRNHIDTIASDLHITRTRFAFCPAERGEQNDTIELVFEITVDALLTPEQRDQRNVDDEFSKLISGFEDPTESKIEAAKEELKDHLDDWFKD